MWNKIKVYIISGTIGFILGIIITITISQGIYNRKFDELSNNIIKGAEITKSVQQSNFRFSEANTRLSESARSIQTSFDRFTKQVRERDTEYQRQLEESRNRFGIIKTGLENISGQLINTGETLQGIAEGLEPIKVLIQNLPID